MNLGKLLLIVFAGLWSLLTLASSESECPSNVTVEQLLKNREKYDQKIVCVTGRLRVQFEGDQLSLGASKIWLDFFSGPEYTDESIDRDTKRMKEWERLYQNQCVVVRGRFSLKNTGHFGMWPAGIEQIENIAKATSGSCSPNTSLNLTRYVGASRLVARRLALR